VALALSVEGRIEEMRREVNRGVVTVGCVRVPPSMRLEEEHRPILSL
jgi:hypothetical protein